VVRKETSLVSGAETPPACCVVVDTGYGILPMCNLSCTLLNHGGRLYASFERFFVWLHGTYEHTLRVVMRHRRMTLGISFAILIATGWLFDKIPKGFFPPEDTGQIRATTEAVQGISFEAMREHQMAAAKIVSADTNVLVRALTEDDAEQSKAAQLVLVKDEIDSD